MADEGFPKGYGPSAEAGAGLGADPGLTRRVLNDVMFGDPGSTPLREGELLLTEAGGAQKPPIDHPEAPADADGGDDGGFDLTLETDEGESTTIRITD